MFFSAKKTPNFPTKPLFPNIVAIEKNIEVAEKMTKVYNFSIVCPFG